jgi:serine/threonine-protein kinase SRPK3
VCRKLFEYAAYEQHGLDAESGLLWQMMCFTGEQFTPEQLQASFLSSMYFDETCTFFIFHDFFEIVRSNMTIR